MKPPDPLLKVKDTELWDWVDSINLILSTGKYEFPIYSEQPGDTLANEGESLIVSTGTTRELQVYINGVWATIAFDSAGAVSSGGLSDRITDADANTGVFTEFTADENVIRFYSNGIYEVAISTAGLTLASGYPIVFDGLGGNTTLSYDSATQYLQFYLDGVLRMEL